MSDASSPGRAPVRASVSAGPAAPDDPPPAAARGADWDTSLSLPGTLDDVRRTVQEVDTLLAARGIVPAVRGDMQVVLAEVLNNVVEHALADAPLSEIAVHLACHAGLLCFEVCDPGKAMPHFALPKGEMPDIDVALDSMPEGGFGWFLIREMTQSLDYDRCAAGNRLRFSLALHDRA